MADLFASGMAWSDVASALLTTASWMKFWVTKKISPILKGTETTSLLYLHANAP
jgi:hypothetical protein